MNTSSVISVGILLSSIKDISSFFQLHEYIHASFKYYEVIVIGNPSEGNQEKETAILSRVNTRFVVLNDDAPEDLLRKKIFELAIGDFVVLFDPVESDIELIEKLVATSLDGADFTCVEYTDKSTSFYARTSKLFFAFISKISGLKLNSNLSYTGCYSRALVNTINNTETGQGYFRLLLASAGFSGKTIPAATRKNRSVFYVFHRLGNSLDIIGSAPYRLLQLTAWSSLASCFGSLLYILYVLFVWLFMSSIQPGWTTTALTQGVLFGTLFFAIFVFSCIFSSQIGKNSQHRFTVARDVSRSEFISSFNDLNVTSKQ